MVKDKEKRTSSNKGRAMLTISDALHFIHNISVKHIVKAKEKPDII